MLQNEHTINVTGFKTIERIFIICVIDMGKILDRETCRLHLNRIINQ